MKIILKAKVGKGELAIARATNTKLRKEIAGISEANVKIETDRGKK